MSLITKTITNTPWEWSCLPWIDMLSCEVTYLVNHSLETHLVHTLLTQVGVDSRENVKIESSSEY